MNIDIKKNKEEFIQLLKSTKREGIDNIIEDMEEEDYYLLGNLQ